MILHSVRLVGRVNVERPISAAIDGRFFLRAPAHNSATLQRKAGYAMVNGFRN